MKIIAQRCKESSVTIDKKVNGSIKEGFVVLVGFTHTDTKEIVDKMVNKLVNLRVFKDKNDLMNRNIIDTKGQILSISQFTLYANCKKGRRPSFVSAMNPADASSLYDYFNEKVRSYDINVQTGIFGSDMKVNIYNDGPVTIYLDSKEIL